MGKRIKNSIGVIKSTLTAKHGLLWIHVSGEQLQRVQIKLSPMERCENISIPTVNSICTEPPYLTDDCNVRVKHYFQYLYVCPIALQQIIQHEVTTYSALFSWQEEELAGSPMLCLLSDNKTWTLVGVSNWRIACSKSGTERPRLYDKITSNIEWIHKTMSAISWVWG